MLEKKYVQTQAVEATLADEPSKENVDQLRSSLKTLLRWQAYDTARVARLESLLGRKHTFKWRPARKAKTVRRLMASIDRLKSAETDIDVIQHRLSQHVEET